MPYSLRTAIAGEALCLKASGHGQMQQDISRLPGALIALTCIEECEYDHRGKHPTSSNVQTVSEKFVSFARYKPVRLHFLAALS